MNFENGVQFDPGFVQHISAIMPNIEYAYGNLNRYKNFGQKKAQFKMIYPKLMALVNNYIGFYAGCVLWAVAIKTLGEKPVMGNFCCGAEYNEEETLQEVNFLIEYVNYLPKDIKYYLGQNYVADNVDIKILEAYREFLKANKGFTELKTTADIVIPECISQPDDVQKIFDKVEEVVESGKLFELKELIAPILKV